MPPLETKALIVAFSTKDLAGAKTAAEETLNRHLAEGWRVARIDPMGGAGSNDYHSSFASIVVLERGASA
jgi:hypothetical protein